MHYIQYYFVELRLRGFYFLLSIGATLGMWYTYKYELLYLWSRPIFHGNTHFYFFEIPEAFSILLGMTLCGSLYILLPYCLYSLWQFFAPGLYMCQRSPVIVWGVWSLVLCFGGFFLSYFVLFPRVCEFLVSFEFHSSSLSVEYMPRIESYMTLVFRFFLGIFGLSQLPLLVCIGFSKNLFHWHTFRVQRKFAVCFCVLIAALFSPPDLLSQLILSSFLYTLYECLLFCGILFELFSPYK